MKFSKTILSNGVRLVTVPMPDNPSVTVLVAVETGSKYEDKRTNGLSHFLEHMVFKGTPRRPKAIDISRELDSIGSNYNAFTAWEYTGYYAKAASKHLEKILDIVSDMYLNPLFEESEIQKEKGVIVEEIRMYKDLPQSIVHDVFMEVLYDDQPAGWNIAGTEENVKSFTQKHFKEYRALHYVADATTVIVAGSFDEKKITDQVEKAFATIVRSKKAGKLAVTESQNSPQIKTHFKETDQTHIVIGVRTLPELHPKLPALNLMSAVLGDGMSSRLFSKMRDQLGICYYIKAHHSYFTDHGHFTISAGVDNSRVKEAIIGIMEECERLKTEPVSDAELRKVKDGISGGVLLGLETSEARAEFFGLQEVEKHTIESLDEMLKKIEAVTAEDIKAVANEFFVNEKLNMAVVGRFKDGEAFKDYFKFN